MRPPSMTDLSPAAQAVVNGAIELDYGAPTPVLFRRLAGALRAAADLVDDREATRQLNAIAYELEAQ